MKLAIKRMTPDDCPDAYVLVDEDGAILPFQIETQLVTKANEPPRFTVTFAAGSGALQVIDER